MLYVWVQCDEQREAAFKNLKSSGKDEKNKKLNANTGSIMQGYVTPNSCHFVGCLLIAKENVRYFSRIGD